MSNVSKFDGRTAWQWQPGRPNANDPVDPPFPLEDPAGGDTTRRAIVGWAELEVPTAPRRAVVGWAECEVPNAPRRGVVGWAEFEVPNVPAPRRAQIGWAEFEVPNGPRRAVLGWTEFEVPNAPRRGVLGWAELEVPTAPRRGVIGWAEFQVPTAPDVGGSPLTHALLAPPGSTEESQAPRLDVAADRAFYALAVFAAAETGRAPTEDFASFDDTGLELDRDLFG